MGQYLELNSGLWRGEQCNSIRVSFKRHFFFFNLYYFHKTLAQILLPTFYLAFVPYKDFLQFSYLWEQRSPYPRVAFWGVCKGICTWTVIVVCTGKKMSEQTVSLLVLWCTWPSDLERSKSCEASHGLCHKDNITHASSALFHNMDP